MKLTITTVEMAKADVLRTNASVDVQLSPRVYATFGTSGLTVTKVMSSRKALTKWVPQWRIKTAAQINESLSAQEWKQTD